MPITKRLEILDLVRHLRQQLNLSQKQFAAKLGVSFKTVNWWENRHTLPSPLALKLIKEMLRQMEEPGKRLLNQNFPEAKSDYDL
ncbi:MAG: helix-turn-helix domain-containing protein [Nostoc sp. DedVER02]|uniref:helix-turn-helix domain-containing protein n=1 Tax=unclassified Nostoc TaxID=2593658 RepID=UPI002AD49BB8|nr:MULTISPECIES: helix-turn-helix transcriptional regulator [unclassified Nostoc]MDZ7988068.1 helix-turn-helix transcriptional regulator [Nostoc sp. DedVER02]MDZ8111659.1 helix-turn-helix transcriptional regulator [Nostoc sp. DedVER01b]